jgi:hypothetical protein
MSDQQQSIERPARALTRYRILWGRMPDPENQDDDGPAPRPVYREILNRNEKDGAYVATSAETARRAAFLDEASDQYAFVQQSLRSHGVILKHVALSSWGDDDEAMKDPLRIATREDLMGRV